MTDETAGISGAAARTASPAGRFRLPEWGQSLASLASEWRDHIHGRRLFLWSPIAMACGIGAYFALPGEPPLAALLVPLAGLLAAHSGLDDRPGLHALSFLLALVLLGASVAKMRVDRLDRPHLEEPVSVQLSGTVRRIEERAGRRTRILLDVEGATSRSRDVAVERVRVTTGAGGEALRPGDFVTVPARLMPPPGPVVPGGYDLARAAFFEGIDAVGYAFGSADLVRPRSRPTLAERLGDLRRSVAERIRARHDGQSGALAVALLVGDRSGLSPTSVDQLRRSGLAHVLAISGLHMSLFAGSAFFATRLLLAALGTLALRWPVKKIAAVAGLAAAGFYLAISGAGTSTIRAFIMASVAFFAILVDRQAISMRNLALAALPILALTPESVLQPGFQMSFLSVAALIAVYEHLRLRRSRTLGWRLADPRGGLGRRFALVFGGIGLTTLVAGLATAPISIYHFQTVATYSVPANMLAMPLVTFLVMPFGLLTMLAMPFGLEALPLTVMVEGLSAVLGVAEWIAGFDGAFHFVTKPAAWGIVATAGAMLLGCIATGRSRTPALVVAVGAFVVTIGSARAPDLFIADGGAKLAVRQGDQMMLSGVRAGSFVADQWARAAGIDPTRAYVTHHGCDGRGCLFPLGPGKEIAHVRHPSILEEECRRADLLISALPGVLCTEKRIAVTGGADGAALVELHSDGRPLRIRNASVPGRPWRRRPADPSQ